MEKEKNTKALKPIDIINNIDKIYTSEEIERAWVATMSAQPRKDWLKNIDPKNPDNKWMKDNDGKLIPYMPIEILEKLMDTLLMYPQLKILSSHCWQAQTENCLKTLAHMDVELKYFNHGINDWCYTSGTSSMEISGKQSWTLIFPKLKAEAYKNACKSIGNIFGRRIGREDMIVTDETIVVKKSTKEKILESLNGGSK